jgi:hypothetical protein
MPEGGRGMGPNGLTIKEAIRLIIKKHPSMTAVDILDETKKIHSWSDDSVMQHIMQLTINLQPAFHHWPYTGASDKFLFLRSDGYFEEYHPESHGDFASGIRLQKRPRTRTSKVEEGWYLAGTLSSKLLMVVGGFVIFRLAYNLLLGLLRIDYLYENMILGIFAVGGALLAGGMFISFRSKVLKGIGYVFAGLGFTLLIMLMIYAGLHSDY